MRKERIKELIEERGMSVSSFARAIGLSQPTLYRILNGEVNIERIGVNNFMRIAHGLGLTAEALYYDLDVDDLAKAEIDSTYSATTAEGRRALLATAKGVQATYGYAAIPFPPARERGEDEDGAESEGEDAQARP